LQDIKNHVTAFSIVNVSKHMIIIALYPSCVLGHKKGGIGWLVCVYMCSNEIYL